MIRTLDFNTFPAGTVIDDEYAGVTISASGGSGEAMIFDSANPTGGDYDLQSDTLGGLLIISEDGDSNDPDDNAGGGSLFFDFANEVQMKEITLKDIEETATLNFFDADGNLIKSQFVQPTGDGGEVTIGLDVSGVARFEVVLQGSGAIDNVTFDDPGNGVPAGDGVVSNGDEGDLIDINYDEDPEGDRIDDGDALLPGEGPQDDIVDARGGDDTVNAGLGNDEVYAGSGDDVVDGGDGDDVIFGDSIYDRETDGPAPADTGTSTVRESFEWDLAGAADTQSLAGGFSQDTGNVTVTFTELNASRGVQTEFSSDQGLVDGIETDGTVADDNSALQSVTNGHGNIANYELGFSNPVENVDFRINDIDGDGIVRVLAFSPDGTPIEVNLTGGDNVTLFDTDSVAGVDTADSNGGFANTDNPTYSVLVDIPGPVGRIVIQHGQNGAQNSGIQVTDVYFDVTTGVAGVPGNDDLSGGEGDDLIFGEEGDDTLTGGAGADTLSGGADADVIRAGAGDEVDGGAGGFSADPDANTDNDVLDLTGQGSFIVEDEVADGNGNGTNGTIVFVDGDGNPTGETISFTEIEEIIGDRVVNGAPDAVDDASETLEDTPVLINLLANDSDPDLDPLSVVSATVPADQGSLVDNGDGTVTFTPAPDFNGEATITYTITDPGGLTDTAVHTVTVTPQNDAPVAVDDTAATPEDTPVVVDLIGNDTDVDGDPLTLGSVTVPADQGTLVDNGDGTVTFTPAPDFNGEATISYTVTDGNGGFDEGEAVVTVTPVNDAPDAVDDSDSTDEDTPVIIDLLANDTDVDGDTLTVVEATVPADQGTLEENPDGTFTFTPAPDFNGDATITYTIEDEEGLQDTAIHTVVVGAANDAPDAVDDSDETLEDTPVVINLLANDSDPDLDPLTVVEATVPAEQGTVEDNGDGTFTFTPAPDFNGEATITYTIEDPDGLQDTALHTVTVTPVNDDPDAVDDSDSTDEDTPVIIDLLANDSDVDGDTLSVTAASVPTEQGSLVENADGTFTFTPAPDFNGIATIEYTITDGNGGFDSALHTVDVGGVNDAPTAVDDTAETPEDTPVVIDLIGNDTDPDGDPLTLGSATVPADQGTLVDNGDGTVTFTPAPDFNGEATITYTVTDGNGGEDEGQAIVTVSPVNDAPDAVDDSNDTVEDTPVIINLLANDSDPDLDPLTVVEATVPAEQGTIEDNSDGTFTFTPAPDFNGEATITYTIEDPDGLQDTAIHTVNVAPVGDAPTAVDDTAETPEDTPVIIDLIGNDTDPDGDPLTLGFATVPAEQGTLVDNGDGTVTFTPAPDFNGEATITYTVQDPEGNTDEGEAIVTVTPVNDAPDAVDDSDSTEEDTPVIIDLLANDSDVDGDMITVVEATVPADQGTLEENPDGTFTFTPAPDFNGDATITYTIEDEEGLQDTAIHTVNVGEVNDAPDAVDDSSDGVEDTPVIINLLANDSDPDLDPLTVVSAEVPASQGTLEDNGDGTFTFTPAPDFNGTATVIYTIEDPDGLQDTAVHTINIAPVNDAPDAVDDVDVTPEDTPITVDLLANDSDVDGDELTVISVSVPAEQGTIVDNGDGTATFTPAEDFVGEVTISYTIEDEEGLQDSAEHTVYVNAVSDGPVAEDDVAETPEDTPVTIDVLGNDSDPDGDDLIISEATVPEEQGTVEIVDGALVFTPAPDFNGEAVIDYVAEDQDGNEAPAQVIVTVTPVNDAPEAEDDSDITDLNTPITVDLLANDSDADGDDLTVVDATVPADQGTLVDNGDGTVTFTPADGFLGEATISYTIEDEEGLQDSAVHTITVNDPDNAPTANDDTAETAEDTPVTIDVVANDTDPTDDPLTITEATVPEEQGTVEIVDNELVFTPAEDFTGEAEITYTVEDPDGNAGEATATVTVTPVNDAPDAVDDEDVTDFQTPVTVDLLANDSDPDGDDLTVVEATVPAEQGTLVDNGDGTVTFTPADGFEGEATITYTIEDEEGLQDTAEHVITVGDNDAPVAVDDEAETPEDTPVTIDLVGNDTDENGDPLELKEATVPADQGTLVDNGDGTVTFTPAPDFNGEATITYVICDPSGAEDEGQAVVTVTPVNDAPVAEDDSDVTDEDTPVTVDLLANDSDVDGDDLTVVDATVPADQGTLVDNGDGTVTFTPAPGFTGEATITYTIEDEEGLQDTAEHTITVNEADEAPTAVDDIAETDEDTPVTIDVLENDTDPTDDPLTITEAFVPEEQGTVEIVDGELVFTPADDFTGEATITYTIQDPDGNADEGTATVTVNPVNDAPDAVDDVATTEEDTPVVLDLVDNDSDPDGDPLTVTDVSVPPEQGTIVNNGDGTATFTPAPDFVGEATVTYTISDGNGGEDTAEHVVDVTPLNDAPVAVDDVAETDEDTPVTIDLLGNDTDVDGDPLELKEVSVPEEQGTVVDNGDGTVTFTPAPDFNGEATITYVICDPTGAEDEGEAVVTVNPVNDAPVAEDDEATTILDEPVTIDLLANDSDPDGDPLTVTEVSVPPEQGTVTNNGDGTVTFTPAPGFSGMAMITYTITDPDGLTDTAEAIVTIQDGVVEGTDDGELIDETFDGDPEGDQINDDPQILPGTDPLDDSVTAGGGDDTVITGDGSDTVEGGTGDDVIDTSGPDLAPDLGYPFADSDVLGFDPDLDPENDRDSVDGGEGNDTITTGDDRDTITGGAGEDVIDSGIDDDIVDGGEGDDRIVGGEGNDSILGGDGNDTIFAGNDPDLGLDVLDIPDDPTADNPFAPDRNPDNGQDTVDGGAGDDVIFGADDDDVLLGGEGDDFIDGQIDDDVIDGNQGDDTLIGGQGDDSLRGGQDDDLLQGGIGDDTLRGNLGEDTLEGGEGDDLLDGGAGDDTLDGGEGDDTMAGGDDRDLFINVNPGDVVDGGDGGDDFDTLDLTGSLPPGGTYVIDFTSDDREDGIVNYFDADGNDAGQLVFEEIENIIPCFTPGTKIATPKGERLVEDLAVGDRIITRDNGIQEIRWVGARKMSGAELERAEHLKPVLIRQGALGNDLPERDMMVSPNHRVLVANDKTALYFEEREVLVAAKHLTGLEGVDIVDVSETTYIHIMFDQHEVILSDGAWTESFQPGDQSLAGIGNAQRQEILELFPELATEKGVEAYASARRSLKKHEAKLITK